MDYSNDYTIEDLITSYYGVSLKNNLEFFNINTEEEKKIILSYFYQPTEFKSYNHEVEEVLQKSIDRLNKGDLEEKIHLFLSDKVFPNIDKRQFIPPGEILSEMSLTTNVLRMFLKRVLHKTILFFISSMVTNKKFYRKALNNEMFYDAYVSLRASLHQYNKAFLNFYTGLVNKYDKTGDFILPVYNLADNNVYFSKVNYHSSKPETLQPLKFKRDHFDDSELKKIHQFNKEMGLTKEDLIPLGGADAPIHEAQVVKHQLDEMFDNNIKHVYDKDELKKLEVLLENKKINALIARKELKLNPSFNRVIQKLLQGEMKEDDRKKYFDELFDVSDGAKLTKEELYDVYKNEPNKNGFIKYVVDKTMHQSVPTLNETRDSKVVALVDNIFSKILTEDYNHNTLNLQDDDIKFILMLETLNAIKTSSIGNSSNVTVNLFRDVDKTRVNKDEFTFN